MAKYVAFIYEDETRLSSADADTIQSIMAGHQKFAEKNGASLRGGGRVAPSDGAVSLRSGASSPDKAPFLTEPGPRITGYYIYEAADIDQAADIANDIPAKFGGVEVRELV